MATFKLIVWSRLHADLDAVRDVFADPSRVAAALPTGVTWAPRDPEAYRGAWRGVRPDHALPEVVGVGGLRVAWPLEVVDLLPGLRMTTRTSNAWWSEVVHRRRLERAIGGHVRYVDELILQPAAAWPVVAVPAVARTLAHVHRALGACLSPVTLGEHRVFRLETVNAGHAEALLSGVDLPAHEAP